MEDLGRLDDGIRFPDGSYFSSLMVYHQLHCIVSHPQHHRGQRTIIDHGPETALQTHVPGILLPKPYSRRAKHEPPSQQYVFPWSHVLLQANLHDSVHCLDSLRQGIMCQGDTSLLTMRWGKMQAIPLANLSSPHQCVDWNRLDAWAEERSVDVFQSGMLVHPVYGTLKAYCSLCLGEMTDWYVMQDRRF